MARTAPAVNPGGARGGRSPPESTQPRGGAGGWSPRSQHSAGARRLDRRQALVALLGIPLAVTGCTSGEPGTAGSAGSAAAGSRHGKPTGQPDRLAEPVPDRCEPRRCGRPRAGPRRSRSAILRGRAKGQLSASRRAMLSAIRDAHLAHVAALRSPEPTSRPTPTAGTKPRANPSLERLSLATALPALIKAEKAAAAASRRAALGRTASSRCSTDPCLSPRARYAAALAGKRRRPVRQAGGAAGPADAVRGAGRAGPGRPAACAHLRLSARDRQTSGAEQAAPARGGRTAPAADAQGPLDHDPDQAPCSRAGGQARVRAGGASARCRPVRHDRSSSCARRCCPTAASSSPPPARRIATSPSTR